LFCFFALSRHFTKGTTRTTRTAHSLTSVLSWFSSFLLQYHHHGYSWKCMRAQFASTKGHSPLAGYALDGHGIYGPRDVDGEMITNAKLDKCHGHYGPVEWEGKVR
jgi:hypothetical protein